MGKGNDNRPTAQDTARRLLIFGYLIAHAITNPPPSFLAEQLEAMEKAGRKKKEDELNEKVTLVRASLRLLGLWDLMTDDEQKFLSTPAHKQEYGRYYEAECRIEAAVCLLWALKYLDGIPQWDADTDPKIISKIPSTHDQALLFVRNATLVKPADLDEARDASELWHWRSKTRELEKEGVTPPKKSRFKTLDELVRSTAETYHAKEMLPDLIDGDFPAFGRAYRDLTDNEWMHIRTITIERHRAFNWLCGFAPKNRWDKTPIEV